MFYDSSIFKLIATFCRALNNSPYLWRSRSKFGFRWTRQTSPILEGSSCCLKMRKKLSKTTCFKLSKTTCSQICFKLSKTVRVFKTAAKRTTWSIVTCFLCCQHRKPRGFYTWLNLAFIYLRKTMFRRDTNEGRNPSSRHR